MQQEMPERLMLAMIPSRGTENIRLCFGGDHA